MELYYLLSLAIGAIQAAGIIVCEIAAGIAVYAIMGLVVRALFLKFCKNDKVKDMFTVEAYEKRSVKIEQLMLWFPYAVFAFGYVAKDKCCKEKEKSRFQKSKLEVIHNKK